MAIIPVYKRLPPTPAMLEILECLPDTWVDDGLSCFPDSVLGFDISPAGTIHDARYCTRLWRAGALDRAWRERHDTELGENVRALLPFGLRWIGYVVFLATYELGGLKAFDSCGLDPFGADEEQALAGLCRHGVPVPEWLRGGA